MSELITRHASGETEGIDPRKCLDHLLRVYLEIVKSE